jgi:hypothetical protein
MWIVLLALRRPYTFVVAALLLVLLTPLILLRTPTDIFPAINIPVISIVWQYAGLDSQQFEQRITYAHERILTVTVNNIEHIESSSYNGISVRGFRRRPDHRVGADGAAPDAAGNAAAADHPIQRGVRADFAIQLQQF